jgi:lipoate-protein ligase B
VIWLLEHDPVYTTGRHGRREDLYVSDDALAELGASFHAIDRGGQMTWHGPGQTTGYVIADLRPHRRLREFVDALIEGMRRASGLEGAHGDPSALGLYVEGRKLGSVGVRVSGGITTHGLALNRAPDLTWFQRMTACAAPDVAATSIAAEGGDPDRARVERSLAEGLADSLDLAVEEAALDDLAVGAAS